MSSRPVRQTDPLAPMRHLDLLVLLIALPVFLVAGLPMLGYATGAIAWLVQKGIRLVVVKRAAASSDPRTLVGLMAGSLLARGWLVALAIFLIGLKHNEAGLTSAVLVLVLMSFHVTTQLVMRPFDKPGAPS